jgi:hypothetical protein
MKTLGQIAFEAVMPQDALSWEQIDRCARDEWSCAAQAVRAQVIEECALDMERIANVDLYASREWQLAAKAIRLLKENKETT